jgi:hypothetical protein
LRALDREAAALDKLVRDRVRESLLDPRPDLGVDEAFELIRGRARDLKACAENP